MNLSNLFSIVIFAFIVRTLRNSLYFIFLWQMKEYRIDRIEAHLHTDQGRRLIFGPMTLVKWILLLIILLDIFLRKYLPFKEELIWILPYVIFWIIWIIEALLNIRELISRGWRLPKFTLKVILILLAVFFIQFGTLNANRQVPLILGPLLDKLLAPSVAFIVVLLSIPTWFFKKIIVILAKRKISQRKSLIVIGITGSYGKTSTKEFLAQILSAKYHVLKTEGSTNTEIGIAKTVLNKLTANHEVFIVEMGAYKEGEIIAICKIVKPQIGIITGINQQHIELFGSIESTMKTKFELIENLRRNGTAVFNLGNKYVYKMFNWTKEKRPDMSIWGYQKAAKEKLNLQKETQLLFAKDIVVSAQNLSFQIVDDQQQVTCSAGLLGEQNVENILAAGCVALSLGLTPEELKKAVEVIEPPVKTMRLVKVLGGTYLIDDTFNANPDGVIAAIAYMKIFAGRKILVLTPLIELGEEAERIHKFLGKKAAELCDLILLTNLNYYKSFIEGAAQAKGEGKIQVVNTIVGEKLIRQNLSKKSVVVFEGREAGRILDQLVKLD